MSLLYAWTLVVSCLLVAGAIAWRLDPQLQSPPLAGGGVSGGGPRTDASSARPQAPLHSRQDPRPAAGSLVPAGHDRSNRPGRRPLGPDDRLRPEPRHVQLRLPLVPHALRGGHRPEPLGHRLPPHRDRLRQLVLPAELRAAARGRDPDRRPRHALALPQLRLAGDRLPRRLVHRPALRPRPPQRRRRRDPARVPHPRSCASRRPPRTTSRSPRCCSPRSRSCSRPGPRGRRTSGEETAGGRLALPVGWPLAAAGLAVGLAAGTKVTVLALAGGAERRRDRARPRRPPPRRRRLVVRPRPARRRLLVPAQPDRRRQPDPRDRPPRPDHPARTPSTCRPPGPTSTSPTTRPTPASGATTSSPASTTPSAASGRWCRWRRSPAAILALGWGRNRAVRWIGGVVLFGMLAYLFTPLSAAGAEGRPTGFELNIRYVAAGPARRPRPAAAAALPRRPAPPVGAARRACSRCSSSPTAPTPSCAIPRASSASAWRCSWSSRPRRAAGAAERARPPRPGPGRRPSPPWPSRSSRSATRSSATTSATASATTCRREERLPGYDLDSAYRWAQDVRDARIGLAGTTAGFLGYGFYGADLSNRVVYLGEEGPHGAFNAIPTCAAFRAAVNDADLDYLVTSPFLNFIDSDRPVRLAGGGLAARRAAGRRRSNAAARSRLEGERPPRPRGLRPRQRAARRICPNTRRLTPATIAAMSAAGYSFENALFEWEEGTAQAAGAERGPRRPPPRRPDRRRDPRRAAPPGRDHLHRRRAGRLLRAGHRMVPAAGDGDRPRDRRRAGTRRRRLLAPPAERLRLRRRRRLTV